MGSDGHARAFPFLGAPGRPVTSLVAAVPGFGGVVTSRLPVSGALGAAAQGLVLCAIAGEHDVHDEAEVVALLGAVMFRRDLSPKRAGRARSCLRTPRSTLGPLS